MLTTKEINEYIHGREWMHEKKRGIQNEAKEIGDALGVDWKRFDVAQFAMGLNVEREHGRRHPQTDVTHDDPVMTGKIALVHLNAIPDYYTRLAAMVHEAEQGEMHTGPEAREKTVQ